MQHGDFNIILGLPDRALPTVDDKFSQTETTSFILLHIVCPYNVVTLCGPEYGECIWIAHHHERKMSVRFYARPQGTLILNRPCNLIPLGNVRRRLSTPLFFVRLVAARQKSWAVSGWHCWLGCCCCHYLLVSEIKISRHGGPRRRRSTPTHRRRCERTAKRHGADRYVRWRKGACWSTTAQQKRKKKERYPVSPLTRFQYCKSFIESKSIKTGKVLERLSQQHKNHGQ